ncbi:hypothetical protein B0T18DRAFT_180270 [Schizothecium vesticola]|uniref:Uncharacterized protein n=1 Tax=Schizothecium vesticola TaxID=314040 RepID=A0AA40K276_9PEZI|nr:hypothetical protein B0T18DRAFT_180270 [Schizothecium vesticola]
MLTGTSERTAKRAKGSRQSSSGANTEFHFTRTMSTLSEERSTFEGVNGSPLPMGGLSSGRRKRGERKRIASSCHQGSSVYNISASQPARGHFFRQQVTLGIQWTFGKTYFGTSTRYQVFLWFCFYLSGRDGGRAEVGNLAAVGREGIPNGWDGWVLRGTCVVHLLFLCRVFACVFRNKRERRIPCGNSCQLRVGFMLTAPVPPPPPHTHYLLECERSIYYPRAQQAHYTSFAPCSYRCWILLSF